MSDSYVPEMHDLGKLVDNYVVESLLGVEIDGHYFRTSADADLDYATIGVTPPSSSTWIGIQHHNDPECKSLVRSPLKGTLKTELVLTALADVLAASSSRATPEERVGEFKYPAWYKTVHRLWNPQAQTAGRSWSPIGSIADLREMIGFVNGDPNAADFVVKYRDYLERIPEDKTPPRVVTSLLTHLTLVGKYYRVLQKHVQLLLEGGEPVALVYDNHRAVNLGEMLSQWQYQIAKCKLSNPLIPVRVRDLNVLGLLKQHINDLLHSAFRDHVLFHTSDTLYLFLPTDGSVRAEDILEPYLNDGFYAETQVTTFHLGALNFETKERKLKAERQVARAEADGRRLENELAAARRELERLRRMGEADKRRWGWKIPEQGRLVANLQAQLGDVDKQIERWRRSVAVLGAENISVEEASIYDEPIANSHEFETDLICELCQMRPATQRWTTPDELLEENLCEVCFGVRDAGETHGAIGRWERETPNAPIAWVKLSLDYDWAQIHVETLFEEFIDGLVRDKPETPKQWASDAKAGLRPVALLADFTEDYRRFTQRFAALLRQPGDGGRGIDSRDIVELTHDLKDFYIIRLYRASDAVQIVEAFERSLREFFPKALESSPVRLSLSVANVKHPFFEHWRFCQSAPEVISVQLVGRAQLHLSIEQYDVLRTLPVGRREVSAFLHRVATVEAETGSRILPQVEFMQDERKLPENIATALRSGKLDWRDVLNYYKLVKRQ